MIAEIIPETRDLHLGRCLLKHQPPLEKVTTLVLPCGVSGHIQHTVNHTSLIAGSDRVQGLLGGVITERTTAWCGMGKGPNTASSQTRALSFTLLRPCQHLPIEWGRSNIVLHQSECSLCFPEKEIYEYIMSRVV